MQERETIEVKAPVSGVTVVLKAYLTGREKRTITNAALPDTIDYDNADGVKGLNPLKIMNDGEDSALRTVIVSIDGQTEGDFSSMVLDMHVQDSDFITKKVKEISDGLNTEKKTT